MQTFAEKRLVVCPKAYETYFKKVSFTNRTEAWMYG